MGGPRLPVFTSLCVCERVRHRLWGTCNNRTMVPHKEIQWNNGTPQGNSMEQWYPTREIL